MLNGSVLCPGVLTFALLCRVAPNSSLLFCAVLSCAVLCRAVLGDCPVPRGADRPQCQVVLQAPNPQLTKHCTRGIVLHQGSLQFGKPSVGYLLDEVSLLLSQSVPDDFNSYLDQVHSRLKLELSGLEVNLCRW